MRVVFLLLFLLLPLLVSIHAEDLGELNANPARLSGSFSSFGLSGFFDPPDRFSGPANKTDQIDQTNEIDQFRLSVLPRLDHNLFGVRNPYRAPAVPRIPTAAACELKHANRAPNRPPNDTS